MIVQACLNGARPAGYHPRLPVKLAALAEDAAATVAAGANELHLHVRAPDGRESLAPEHVDATLAALRARVPGTLIGISTGAWIEPDDDRRLGLIANWRELPDHASVNLSETAAPAVIERLHRRGIGIEAGLASVADAERLVQLGLGAVGAARTDRDRGAGAGGRSGCRRRHRGGPGAGGVRKPVLLHGMDATVWPLVDEACRRGFSTRVGLEDGAWLPDGSIAASNAALVAAAIAIRKG